MRIASYNILDGGEGRADPLAEILLAQRADIVALVEADHAEVLARIGRRLGMDLIHAAGNAGHAVALLSRWPIMETINHAMMRPSPPCLLEAVVEGPGEAWRVGVLHLSPRAWEANEAVREEQIASVLEVFEPHRRAGRPHLLVGDFNANGPRQEIDPEQCSPRTRQAWQENGGYIPRRVIQAVLDAGYVDSCCAANGDAAQRMTSFTTLYPGQRVDFIFSFGSESSRVRSAWIERDRLARYASDHYPVGAEFAE